MVEDDLGVGKGGRQVADLGELRMVAPGVEGEAAPVELLDYAAIGGVFATSSKDNPDPPIGVDGLRRIAGVFRRRRADLPLCAIAGIDVGNAGATIAAGADGVAIISALSLSPSPPDAARELRAIIDAALAARVPA